MRIILENTVSISYKEQKNEWTGWKTGCYRCFCFFLFFFKFVHFFIQTFVYVCLYITLNRTRVQLNSNRSCCFLLLVSEYVWLLVSWYVHTYVFCPDDCVVGCSSSSIQKTTTATIFKEHIYTYGDNNNSRKFCTNYRQRYAWNLKPFQGFGLHFKKTKFYQK